MITEHLQADDEELGSLDPDAGSDDNDVPPTQQIPELDDAGEDAAAWEQVCSFVSQVRAKEGR